tara:strand:- start:1120 stop:1308 length:189 start_codon:yes stop_codon:yes gene_type:complete
MAAAGSIRPTILRRISVKVYRFRSGGDHQNVRLPRPTFDRRRPASLPSHPMMKIVSTSARFE